MEAEFLQIHCLYQSVTQNEGELFWQTLKQGDPLHKGVTWASVYHLTSPFKENNKYQIIDWSVTGVNEKSVKEFPGRLF